MKLKKKTHLKKMKNSYEEERNFWINPDNRSVVGIE